MKKNHTATKTTTATADSRKDFATVLAKFETAYTTGTGEQFTDALQEVAMAVSYSVLKKCIDVSQNEQLLDVRRSIARDKNTLNNIEYSSSKAYKTVYTADGDTERQTADASYRDAYNKLTQQTLGDGLDLVNTAIVALLEQCKKVDTSKPAFLEQPYTVRRLKKKVWIKEADSVGGWETVETTPIQEVYKAVRREIEHSRAMSTDARNGYTYLESISTDSETGTEETIYRRMAKYADLGGYATDFNGACTFYSADTATVQDTDEIIDSLELTAKQAKVLQLRMSGYGYKAIASYLGVTQRAVAKTCGLIQKKAIASEKINTSRFEK